MSIVVKVRQIVSMAKRKRSKQKVQTVARPISRVRTIIQRVASPVRAVVRRKRKGAPKIGGNYMSIKKIVVRKGANILGASIDVGFDVAAAALARSTENTYDDTLASALSSAGAKTLIGVGVDYFLGSKAQHVTGGMTGSAFGHWLRGKLAKAGE